VIRRAAWNGSTPAGKASTLEKERFTLTRKDFTPARKASTLAKQSFTLEKLRFTPE
jgi:hypothetical protein